MVTELAAFCMSSILEYLWKTKANERIPFAPKAVTSRAGQWHSTQADVACTTGRAVMAAISTGLHHGAFGELAGSGERRRVQGGGYGRNVE